MSFETVRAFREKVQKANEVGYGIKFPLEKSTDLVYFTHQKEENDSLEELER